MTKSINSTEQTPTAKKHTGKHAKKNISQTIATWTMFWRIFYKVAKIISRIFLGAILLVVLANFAPELREQIPSLYQIVDFLLICLEWILSLVCNIF